MPTNATAQLEVQGRGTNLIVQAGPYRPVIFTAKDDDSMGVVISGSTGVPNNYYGGTALGIEVYESANVTWQNLRFSYLREAMFMQFGNYNFYDTQFVNCQQGLRFDGNVYMGNAVFYNVTTNFYLIPDPANVTLENVTIRGNNSGATRIFNVEGDEGFGDDYWYSDPPTDNPDVNISANNCLFVQFGFLGTPLSLTSDDSTISYGNSVFPLVTNLFQTVGAGGLYLAANSVYQGSGTNSVSPALLALLAQRTTYPPLILTNTFTNAVLLAPYVPRDTNSSPDFGYHYPPIDFLASCIVSNATVTLTNGVAVGYFNYGGIWLQEFSSLQSTGSPVARNYVFPYCLVQEQTTNLWTTGFSSINAQPFILEPVSHANYPVVALSFTTISLANSAGYFIDLSDYDQEVTALNLNNCEVYAGGAAFSLSGGAQEGTIFLTNNLFHRMEFDLDTEGAKPLTLINNVFVGTNLDVFVYDYSGMGGSLYTTNLNNAFEEGSSVYLEGTSDYNAYLNEAQPLAGLQTHDVQTNISWQTGPLGYFYQATNSPLIDAGSTSAANIGLYHYTILTDQVKETNTIVDIGYHYVALGTNGLPVSTSGDGIGDYLKDSNGNGIYDSATDLGNWTTSCTCGDGVNDHLKYIEGRNLNNCASGVDTNGIISLIVFTPLK